MKTVTAEIAGNWYELELSQLIDNFMFFEGSWEEEVTTCLARYAAPGMTVLDIGANIGAHTLHLARDVGETGQVIACRAHGMGSTEAAAKHRPESLRQYRCRGRGSL
jgi:hypothetical protein